MSVEESLENIEGRISSFQQDIALLIRKLNQVMVGQEQVVNDLVIALLADGHILIEGLPGLGKTHLVKALATSIGVSLSRIQCTPDLMPADITGSEVLVKSVHGDDVKIDFRPGPVFCSLLLVDEINRTTPKTQSALLEAMQEHQVTCAGVSHALPRPFWVIATQNPIELEGTFPLPEAQLDRFLFKLEVEYPTADALMQMINISLDNEPADHLRTILSAQRIQDMMQEAGNVVISDVMKRAAINLILSTHANLENTNDIASKYIRYGASPRGLQAILKAARINALRLGRGYVAISDIESVALLALRHRIMLTMESELENIDVDDILQQIISLWLKNQTHS